MSFNPFAPRNVRLLRHKVFIRQRKRDARAKIIVGGVLLNSPESEREALLSMLLPHLTKRDRAFVGEILAGDQTPDPEAPRFN